MREVTNLLVAGATYRLHRNGRKIFKIGFVASQLTVATILVCVAEVAPDDRKTECGRFGCKQKLGAQSQGVC